MIAVIDYGMGNLRSVSKAFQSQGFHTIVTREARDIRNANGIVLPGQGAFRDCMKNLGEYELIKPVKEFISSGKPFLGICMGLQVLFEESEEHSGVPGFGLLRGRVVRFPVPIRGEGRDFSGEKRLKVPHMGWNEIEIQKNTPVLKGIPNRSWFYFVHSYYPEPEDKSLSAIKVSYGVEFTAAVQKGNIFACQFHPEKSGELGLKILSNFAFLCGEQRKVALA